MANFNELIAKANKGNVKCQLILGEHYLAKGDAVTAAEWLVKAATHDAKAQYHLSFLYFKGAGVAKDPVKAADYLKQSAENDYVPAQTQLGSFYIQGIGVPQDEQMGLFWSRKAAAEGSGIAMYNLGIAYFQGLGTSKNIDKARDYLFRSFKKGYRPAKEVLLKEAETFRSETDDDDEDFMKRLIELVETDLTPIDQSTGLEDISGVNETIVGDESGLDENNEDSKDDKSSSEADDVDISDDEMSNAKTADEPKHDDNEKEQSDGEDSVSEEKTNNEETASKAKNVFSKIKGTMRKWFLE